MGARQSIQSGDEDIVQTRATPGVRTQSTNTLDGPSTSAGAQGSTARTLRSLSMPTGRRPGDTVTANGRHNHHHRHRVPAEGNEDTDTSEDDTIPTYVTPAAFNRMLRASHMATPSTSAQIVLGGRGRHALLSLFDVKCPVCKKTVPSDDAEVHLVMCFTRPRITYNEDVLVEDKDECVICLNEMVAGDTIARLPCLCIYHKDCIDSWFNIKNSCPEHPGDE